MTFRTRNAMRGVVSIVCVYLWISLTGPLSAQPRHLYLTWDNEDTAHTQTIVFQTLDKATDPRVEIVPSPKAAAKRFTPKTVMLGGDTRRVHWVTVTGLKPATVYKFRAGDTRYGMSKWKTFKTLPDDNRKLNIASGGDMYRHPETVELLDAASRYTPDVALVGGDIAYADGDLRRVKFWDDWLDNWNDHLNPRDGRLVPMICAIGNHEVQGAFGQRQSNAPFYFAYLPQGGSPYFVRKLGADIDLIVLDSGHVTSYEAQVPFLKKALEESKARFQVAIYHVPCYPTHRPFDDPYSVQGRKYWVPLFDQYHLDLAFENHDHVFKRTYPLKNNKIDPSGTVYLGDGCWGRTPRTVAGTRWYHVKALPKEHVWLMQNTKVGLTCQAVDRLGQIFDRANIKAR